jgi:hypothetical protein
VSLLESPLSEKACFLYRLQLFTCAMNIYELTVNQLKRAVSIKEQLENLGRELGNIFDSSADSTAAGRNKRRGMSAAQRRKIAATQKARWAKLRRAKPPTRSAKRAAKATKKSMSPAARAKLSAKLKAYWAAKKKSEKK